ncbi:hypothetical protein Vadar_024574 [Vaccinium darrowii]|uniref:Uncharacterized protein n=1 Tax=Vaccinium darrowii TaxID=229202 RepID=A0ACB7ZDM9_9ERIC|nr:hypothetical protein Vadar_024574 [Vaccinium darrowii]
MFLESHICWVSSGTVRARYCWEPRDVSGAKPTMKKWSRGNGMRLTASLRSHQRRRGLTAGSSELESTEADIIECLVVQKPYTHQHSQQSWWTESVALYGSTTVSDTFGDGNTEKVSIIRSGYSSLIFDINSVPIPDPVPPPENGTPETLKYTQTTKVN